MNNQRCVLDLKGYGRLFRRFLKDMGLRRDADPMGVISASDLDFAYNECTSQILISLGVDMQRFLAELNTMPDMRRLAHIPQFMHLTEPWQSQFAAKFKEYAFGLVDVVNSTIGIRTDVDYLLEAVAEDYIIIMIAQRTQPNA